MSVRTAISKLISNRATLYAALVACLFIAAPVLAEDPDASKDATPPQTDAAPPSVTPEDRPQEDKPPAQEAPRAERERGIQSAQELSESREPSLGPDTAQTTLEAAKRYAAIADAGGWPSIPKALKSSSKGKAVLTLRRRLAIEGDLSEDKTSGAGWDDDLTNALKRFQFRVGLPQTGVLTKATLKELNVPASVRSRQLRLTAERLGHERFPFGERYVLVNIAATEVEAIENGEVKHRYAAIVGDKDHPSPEINAKIVAININPTWTVPASIIEKELAPKLRRDRNYLRKADIRVFDRRGHEIDTRKVHWSPEHAVKYRFRQDPGAKNSLGALRISMPNKHEVYMHDTPKKKLFDRDYRFLSHGCVRVEGVYDLAAWLLKGAHGSPTGQWDEAAISQKIGEGETFEIRLAHPVEAIWVYMTAWASANGVAHFRHDIYDMNKASDAQVSR